MVPGEGRLPAPIIKNHVVEKVGNFGLVVKKHTINGTLDGCNTNKALGKLLDILIQFCLAHSFQLGIVKVVYVHQKKGNNGNLEDDEDEFETVQVRVEMEETGNISFLLHTLHCKIHSKRWSGRIIFS